jgi:hypothetical protein
MTTFSSVTQIRLPIIILRIEPLLTLGFGDIDGAQQKLSPPWIICRVVFCTSITRTRTLSIN